MSRMILLEGSRMILEPPKHALELRDYVKYMFWDSICAIVGYDSHWKSGETFSLPRWMVSHWKSMEGKPPVGFRQSDLSVRPSVSVTLASSLYQCQCTLSMSVTVAGRCVPIGSVCTRQCPPGQHGVYVPCTNTLGWENTCLPHTFTCWGNIVCDPSSLIACIEPARFSILTRMKIFLFQSFFFFFSWNTVAIIWQRQCQWERQVWKHWKHWKCWRPNRHTSLELTDSQG